MPAASRDRFASLRVPRVLLPILGLATVLALALAILPREPTQVGPRAAGAAVNLPPVTADVIVDR